MNIKLLLLATLLLTACQGGAGLDKQSVNQREVANPYSDGTGHDAGYKWAERTGGSCNGNSESFNEGCEEFYRQQGE